MHRKQLLSALLAAALFAGTVPAAYAVTDPAAVSDRAVTTRQADLDALMEILSKHPDLYHASSKQVFDDEVASIRAALDEMSDLDFAIELSELTALVQDSHTSLAIGNVFGQSVHMLPLAVTAVDEGLLLTAAPASCEDALGGILTAINGVSMEEIKQALTPMLGGDNQVYLNRQFAQTFYVYEILAHYGVLSSPEDIELTVQQDDRTLTVTVDALTGDAMAELDIARLSRTEPATAADKSKYYFAKPLDARTLYIQYNRCMEDPNLPMAAFAQQVQDQLDQNSYDRVIVDLRNNGGGSDGVIIPLMYVLEERCQQDGLALYVLAGSNTFSSALINTVEFKQAGATFVGTPTGGSVDHFGAISSTTLPSGLSVSLSSKFIDLGTLIPAAQAYGIESFSPDVYAPQTRADYLAGVDSAVQAVLTRTDDAGAPAAELSRAALAVLLGRDYNTRTENAISAPNLTFTDVCIVSYAAPYIGWAAQAGVMHGDSQTVFAPDRAVTREEFAAVLARYAAVCGHPLSGAVAPSDAIAPWAQQAVQAVLAHGLMTTRDGAFEPTATVTPAEAQNALQALATLL